MGSMVSAGRSSESFTTCIQSKATKQINFVGNSSCDLRRTGVTDARFAYPVFLDLHDVPVLVVGAGPIGARKVAGLHAAGAQVRLVATVIGDAVDHDMCAEIREHPFSAADLDGVRLVITATGDHDTDAAISDAARERGIWTNAADQPVDCDFILPAIANAGRVTAAISTDGASPALAKALRDRFASTAHRRRRRPGR